MGAQKRAKKYALFTLAVVLMLLINTPIILMILNSFQTSQAIATSTQLLPKVFTLENYRFVSQRTSFWSFLRSSAIISSAATLGTIVAAAMAGYAMSRFKSRLLNLYSQGLLMVQMFPLILALIPLFIIFRELRLIDNYLSVILIYAVVHLPFATFMFKSFFDSIPRALEEAALLDGCTRAGTLLRIILPLSGPGTAAVAIFSFLFSYNEFFIANVFLRKEDLLTIPVGIQTFTQQYATEWGNLLAASTMAMLPTFVLFLFVQRYMMYGAFSGSVKG